MNPAGTSMDSDKCDTIQSFLLGFRMMVDEKIDVKVLVKK